MLRKILLSLFIVAVFLALFLCALLLIVRTDWFWKKALPGYLNSKLSDVVVQKLDYESKVIGPSGGVFFKNLRVTIQKGWIYAFESDEMRLKDIWRFLGFRKGVIPFSVSGFSLVAGDMQAQQCGMEVDLSVSRFHLDSWEGEISCRQLRTEDNIFSNFQAQLKESGDALVLENIIMDYRQGLISGKITLGLNDVFPYVLDLVLNGVVLDQDVFDGNILGGINGTFQASGFVQHLNAFELVIEAPQGSKVRADLLRSIVPYLPSKSSSKKDLESIIKIGGYVYCEVIRAVITKVNDDKALAEISLKSQKLNVVLNPTVDINIEGGLQSILNVIEFFSNPRGHEETP